LAARARSAKANFLIACRSKEYDWRKESKIADWEPGPRSDPVFSWQNHKKAKHLLDEAVAGCKN
jgi:hypothetical protein